MRACKFDCATRLASFSSFLPCYFCPSFSARCHVLWRAPLEEPRVLPSPALFFFFSRRDSFKACLETFSVRRYLRKYLSLGSYPREWSRSKSNSTKEIVGKNDGGKLIIFFFFCKAIFRFDKWQLLIFTSHLRKQFGEAFLDFCLMVLKEVYFRFYIQDVKLELKVQRNRANLLRIKINIKFNMYKL